VADQREQGEEVPTQAPPGDEVPGTSDTWSPWPSLWVVGACIAAGMTAEVGRYSTLWGGGDRFFEYAFPLWMSYGSMHIPGLILGYMILRGLRTATRSTLDLARYLFLGTVLAGATGDFDVQRMDLGGSPLWMFVMVDGATLWLFSLMIIKLPDDAPAHPAWWPLAALLAPALLIGGSRTLDELTEETKIYLIWTSDWYEEQNIEFFWMDAGRELMTPELECAELARVAPDPYVQVNGFHTSQPARHRILHVYATREDMYGENPTMAAFRYEWWPDGRGTCYQLGVDYELDEDAYGRGPFNYPWPGPNGEVAEPEQL
jgi:hypothetical protein